MIVYYRHSLSDSEGYAFLTPQKAAEFILSRIGELCGLRPKRNKYPTNRPAKPRIPRMQAMPDFQFLPVNVPLDGGGAPVFVPQPSIPAAAPSGHQELSNIKDYLEKSENNKTLEAANVAIQLYEQYLWAISGQPSVLHTIQELRVENEELQG